MNYRLLLKFTVELPSTPHYILQVRPSRELIPSANDFDNCYLMKIFQLQHQLASNEI